MIFRSLRNAKLGLLRERYPGRCDLRPDWLLCGSEVFFGALRISNVTREEFRRGFMRGRYVSVDAKTRSMGSRLLPGFGFSTGISYRAPAIRVCTYGRATYNEETGIAVLLVRGQMLPAQAMQAVKGRRLSALASSTSIAALDLLNPVIRSLRNETGLSSTDLRVVLDIRWRTFAIRPGPVLEHRPRRILQKVGENR